MQNKHRRKPALKIFTINTLNAIFQNMALPLYKILQTKN